MGKTNEAVSALESILLDYHRMKYPNVPEKARYVPKMNLRSANGLTRAIKSYINLIGGLAERTGNEGRYLQPKTYTNIFGKQVQLGKAKWIPGTGTKGTADIHGVFEGIALAIEVKIGKDKQSMEQREYQQTFVRAGGYYLVATSFQQFYQEFNERFKIKSPGIPD